jgi:hypothetical protein
MTYCLKRKNKKRFFSFQSMPNLNFAELSLLITKEDGRNSSVAENGEDLRLISLTQGKFAIVDAEDYDRLAQHKWCAVKGRPKRANKKGRKREAYGPLVRN